MAELKTILLDFDNTIYDDLGAVRRTFVLMKKEYRFFRSIPLDELLSRFYFTDYKMQEMLKNSESTVEEINLRRTDLFLQNVGLPFKEEMVMEIHKRIREIHIKVGKPFPGVHDLLKKLKKRYKIGVVTNHMGDYQREKISKSNLESHIDFLIPAYDYCVFKPDKEIFMIALELARSSPEETVMLGDNWNADIKGALNTGIIPIWVNFKNQPAPEPKFSNIIRTFYPSDLIVKKIEDFYSKGLESITLEEYPS